MAASTNKLTTTGKGSRGCSLILKSITLFRAINRVSKAVAPPDNIKVKPKRKTMANKESKCPMRIFEMVKKDSRFNKNEIEALYNVFRKLISINRFAPRSEQAAGSNNIMGKPVSHEGIDRIVFSELLHNTFNLITEDMLMDRIFCVWDKSNTGLVTIESWFWGLSIFLKGTTSEKLAFCFDVYDLNADGFITKEEMFQLLKNCLIKHPQDEDPDEGAKDLAELVLRKMDKDKDGKVSLQDYDLTVKEEPLLVEAFGRCLPDERACETFLSTMKV